MLTRMLMTTVAAFVLAAPVAAQDQAKPEAAHQLEQAQQELPTGQTGPADQAPGAEGQPPAMTAEEETAAPDPAITAEEERVEEDMDLAEDEEAAPPADMTFIEVQDEAQFLADDEVIGKDVFNVMDEEVGTIADLVMDSDQKLVGVVLSVGGFLGIGEKWVAIPVDQIDFPTGDQPARLTVAVTEEQLKNAPDFVTRDTVEAQEAAEQAQQQMQQQQLQQAPPATATQ
jgi:PRC-barrel domain